MSGGSLDIVAKDLDLACQMAREAGAPSRMGAIADEFFKRAQAHGLGHDGYPSVVKILEQMAGAELRTNSAPGVAGYELAVLHLDAEADESGEAPVLRQRLPAGSGSWTPSLGRCLEVGRSYHWRYSKPLQRGTSFSFECRSLRTLSIFSDNKVHI